MALAQGGSIRPLIENLLIWAGLGTVLYALRDVFPIVFLTFLLVYLVRALVVPLAHRISPGRERPGMERWLTLCVFTAIVALLWGLGALIGAQLITQGRLLIAHAQHLKAEELRDQVLARTVGAYLFGQQFGTPDEPGYQAALARFTDQGRAGEGAFAEFGPLQARVQAAFEMAYEEAELARLRQGTRDGATSRQFDAWFLAVKAPGLVAERRAAYLARLSSAAPSSPQADPGGLERRLEELALRDLDAQPHERGRLVAQWEEVEAREQWRILRASPEYGQAFESWFAGPQGRALGIPYDASTYLALRDAFAEGSTAFSKVYQKRMAQTPDGVALTRRDFQRAKELELARQWWAASPIAASLRAHLEQDASAVARAAAERLSSAVRGLIAIPTQVGTALLLTILISFDMAALKRGALRLRESRLRGLYAKVVPSLVAMARLIGRFFAAQGLIALANTLLMLLLLRLLGLGNESLLAALVFIASFIPVLGVILSAIPIVLQALLQPDGSPLLALYAVLGIAVIHINESMILSPRIVGRFLDLHPVLVLAVLVIGEHLFGIWGLLLGVPVVVYAIHAGVLGEPIPGIDDPPPKAVGLPEGTAD